MRISGDLATLLLELRELDAALARARAESPAEPDIVRAKELRSAARALRSRAARLRVRASDDDRLLERNRRDLELVRQRQEQNASLLDRAELDRPDVDRAELGHEARQLDRRTADLQETIADLQQRLTESRSAADDLDRERQELQQQADDCEQRGRELADVAQQRRDEATRGRTAITARIPDDVLDIYSEARQQRGMGVAELDGNQCTACRIELTVLEMQQLRQRPSGELQQCEGCGCILLVDRS